MSKGDLILKKLVEINKYHKLIKNCMDAIDGLQDAQRACEQIIALSMDKVAECYNRVYIEVEKLNGKD